MRYAFFIRGKYTAKRIIILTYLAGIIIGTFLYNCIDNSQKINLNVYLGYLFERINEGNLFSIEYVKYVFFYRFKEIILLIILGLNCYRYIFYGGYMLFMGVKMSIIACIFTMLNNNLMPIRYIIWFFPQIIVYYILIKYVMFDMYEEKKKKKAVVKIAILLIVLTGFEAVINPWLNLLFF